MRCTTCLSFNKVPAILSDLHPSGKRLNLPPAGGKELYTEDASQAWPTAKIML